MKLKACLLYTSYEVIGKNEFGEDIYVFERFLDYQTILELKKFNAEGNFDRISSLIPVSYTHLDVYKRQTYR